MNPKIAEDYDTLVKQFKSLLQLCNSQEACLSYYMKRDYSLSEKRLNELEQALEGEKQMNAQLTLELENGINKTA